MDRELEIWITEYSPSQRVFHVDTLQRILEMNREAVKERRNPGFIPIYVTTSQEDARNFAELWQREHKEGGCNGG